MNDKDPLTIMIETQFRLMDIIHFLVESGHTVEEAKKLLTKQIKVASSMYQEKTWRKRTVELKLNELAWSNG